MRDLMRNLRTIGASDKTVNFVITLFAVFIFILGMCMVVILGIEVIRGQQLSPSIVAILTAITVAAGGLITVTHTTNQINGTAAQSAQAASLSASNNAGDTAALVQQVIAATLAAQRQADTHSIEMKEGQP
jgi:hypothetical protein